MSYDITTKVINARSRADLRAQQEMDDGCLLIQLKAMPLTRLAPTHIILVMFQTPTTTWLWTLEMHISCPTTILLFYKYPTGGGLAAAHSIPTVPQHIFNPTVS
ncbi:MAG: hypothetical protein ABSF60_14190 [Verrucomicrobiota bacterium]